VTLPRLRSRFQNTHDSFSSNCTCHRSTANSTGALGHGEFVDISKRGACARGAKRRARHCNCMLANWLAAECNFITHNKITWTVLYTKRSLKLQLIHKHIHTRVYIFINELPLEGHNKYPPTPIVRDGVRDGVRGKGQIDCN